MSEDARKCPLLQGRASPAASRLVRSLDEVTAELRALESSVLSERDVINALERLDPVWEELFPAEQTRVVQLLVRARRDTARRYRAVPQERGAPVIARGDRRHGADSERSASRSTRRWNVTATYS